MPGPEKAILNVLSVFQRPLPVEAILVGTALASYKLQDTLETLINDSLVQSIFDPSLNDFVYARPRTIQEISQLIDKNWRTADRYVDKIAKEEGTLAVRTFRGGTRGALKVVYWNLNPSISSSFQGRI